MHSKRETLHRGLFVREVLRNSFKQKTGKGCFAENGNLKLPILEIVEIKEKFY